MLCYNTLQPLQLTERRESMVSQALLCDSFSEVYPGLGVLRITLLSPNFVSRSLVLADCMKCAWKSEIAFSR